MRWPFAWWVFCALVAAPIGSAATISAMPGQLEEALGDANPGDTVVVEAGTHEGNFVVDQRVSLRGRPGAVLNGGGIGSVLVVAAANVTVDGLTVEGSGNRPEVGDAGIKVMAANVTVESTLLRGNLGGISLEGATGGIVRANRIEGSAGALAGDSVRAWNSPGLQLVNNTVIAGRDMVFWYSPGALVQNNTVTGARYAVHAMYADDFEATGNRITGSSVGLFIMYSKDVRITSNLVVDGRGPTGYGLGMKDSDDFAVEHNVLARNHVGVFLDHAPSQGNGSFTRNILAANDVGAEILPTQGGGEFRGNTFWGNGQQLRIHGEGDLSSVRWSGNAWSNGRGLDTDGDGLAEQPHVERSLFEDFAQRDPTLTILHGSPTVPLVEAVGQAVPLLPPKIRLADVEPAMEPAPIPAWAQAADAAWIRTSGGLALLAVASTILMTPKLRQARVARPRNLHQSEVFLEVRDLSVGYGGHQVVGSFTVVARSGECVALCGPNGSGKSTLLRALAGLAPATGQVLLLGCEARGDPRRSGSLVGYVPQESALPDWPVKEILRRTARLKGVPVAEAEAGLGSAQLDGVLSRKAGELSGGMRQRLLLYLAMLGDPPVLLLDEPFSFLDAASKRKHLGLLMNLKEQGKLLVIATHNADEVAALANRTAHLEPTDQVTGPRSTATWRDPPTKPPGRSR